MLFDGVYLKGESLSCFEMKNKYQMAALHFSRAFMENFFRLVSLKSTPLSSSLK